MVFTQTLFEKIIWRVSFTVLAVLLRGPTAARMTPLRLVAMRLAEASNLRLTPIHASLYGQVCASQVVSLHHHVFAGLFW